MRVPNTTSLHEMGNKIRNIEQRISLAYQQISSFLFKHIHQSGVL